MSDYDVRDMSKGAIRRNIYDIFESYKNCPSALFWQLKSYSDFTDRELIKLLAGEAQTIFEEFGMETLYSCMEAIPTFQCHFSEDKDESLLEAINEIDRVLAENFENIKNRYFSIKKFNFGFFTNMSRFKEEIKKVGPDFFISFPLDYYKLPLDDCKDIAEELFGEITTENITKIKFGQNDPSKALIIQMVLDELINYSNKTTSKKITMDDVEQIGKRNFFRGLENRKFCFKNRSYEV